MIEVEKLSRENRFDYLLIESTGISEPLPIAQTFNFEGPESNLDLSKWAFIDCMVTVVDALNFPEDFGSPDTIRSRRLNDDASDFRTIVNLLTDQIEFADVIILNKTDLVTPPRLAALRAVVKALNPVARIIETSFARTDVKNVLHTKLF